MKRIVAGIDEVGRGCERPDAEILTNNGWKLYNDINLKRDKVLSYTSEGYIRWQKIERVIERQSEGKLIELKNRGIHMVVTPDHYFTVLRRVFRRDKQADNSLKLVGYQARNNRQEVTNLSPNDFIPRGGLWRGGMKDVFTLPKVNPLKNPVSSRINRNEAKRVDMRLWVAFLGIFLAEGSAYYHKKSGSYKVVISQDRNASQDKYKKIYSLVQKLPFKFQSHNLGFTCHSKQLYTYLKQFGNSHQKFIPSEIKELSIELLNILIDWMIVGDGTWYTGHNRKKVRLYYTASKRLKDDFEEVLLKAGWTYHTVSRFPRESRIKGRVIKKENQVPCFEIRLRRNIKAQVKSLRKRQIIYRGKVFCLQLPKHHNFYVRRNGTGYFTGNSLAGPVVACAVISLPKLSLGRLKDSKQLSAKQREEYYKLFLKDPRIQWGIGRVSERVIDKINIYQATKLAMERAVVNLSKKVVPDFLYIDGTITIESTISQKAVVRGDETLQLCAMASIIAKVTRDRLMNRYHAKYPEYGFNQHKGYGTKLHLRQLERYGVCPIHRVSFAPCKIKNSLVG